MVPDSTSKASAFTTRDLRRPCPKCPRNSRLCTLWIYAYMRPKSIPIAHLAEITQVTHHALYPISPVASMLRASDRTAHALTKKPSWRSICGWRQGSTHSGTPSALSLRTLVCNEISVYCEMASVLQMGPRATYRISR